MSDPQPASVSDVPRLASPRLRIRAARPGDEARLAAVLDTSPEWRLAQGASLDEDAAAQEIAAIAANPGREIALIEDAESGEDVGAIAWWMHRPSAGVALLGSVVIVPARRGQGLAREAVAALEEWLGERGIGELRTAFPRRLFALHRFATALGFREMSIAEHQRLGIAGAGTALWHKPLGDG